MPPPLNRVRQAVIQVLPIYTGFPETQGATGPPASMLPAAPKRTAVPFPRLRLLQTEPLSTQLSRGFTQTLRETLPP